MAPKSAKPRPSPREIALEQDIAALVEVAEVAEGKHADADEGDGPPKPLNLNAAVSARDKITSYRQDLHRIRAVAEANRTADPVERMEALALLCEQDKSWIAAEKYRSEAVKLRIATMEHTRKMAEVELVDLDEDALFAIVEEVIAKLPPHLVQKAGRAVWKRLGIDPPKALMGSKG